MWPNCINELSPFIYELSTELPEFLKRAFLGAGISDEKIFIPIYLVSILGKCSTSDYLDCPNFPEHHIDNSQDEEDPSEYLDEIGEYHWFDFDIIGLKKESLQLRLVLNQGDGDCNDGIWGAVWERNTAEIIANILNTGGEQSTVQAVSKPFIEICESIQAWVPTTFEYCDDDNPTSWLSIKYANNLNLEKFIGLAIRICSVYGG